MNRTLPVGILAVLLIGWANVSGWGHSPYHMWYKWRKSQLFVLTNAQDSVGYALGKAVAAVMNRHLPRSRAMAVRAPNALEVVKLLLSHQFELALLPASEVEQAAWGWGKYEDLRMWLQIRSPRRVELQDVMVHPHRIADWLEGKGPQPTPMRIVVRLGSHLLFSEDHFSAHKAFLIVMTLSRHWEEFVALVPDLTLTFSTGGDTSVPLHPGTIAFLQGRPLPPMAPGEFSWLDPSRGRH